MKALEDISTIILLKVQKNRHVYTNDVFGEDMYPLAIQNLGEGVEKESINKKETPAKPCADQSD